MCDNNLIKLVQNLPNSTAPQLVKDGEPACMQTPVITGSLVPCPFLALQCSRNSSVLSVFAAMLMLLTTVVTSESLLGVDDDSVCSPKRPEPEEVSQGVTTSKQRVPKCCATTTKISQVQEHHH